MRTANTLPRFSEADILSALHQYSGVAAEFKDPIYGFVSSLTGIPIEQIWTWEGKQEYVRESRRHIKVHKAVISDVFPGHVACVSEDGRMFLGLREKYNSAGLFDNRRGDAIFLSKKGEEEKADCLFEFFNSGTMDPDLYEFEKPEIPWEKLHDIPGYEAARLLYEKL